MLHLIPKPVRGATRAVPGGPTDGGQRGHDRAGGGDAVRIRVLVAEPRAALRRQIGLALGRAGMDVDFASSVQGALELTAHCAFHVVVLDPAMEAGGGFDLCRIVARGVRGARVPVIALCGSPSPLTRLRARCNGARACLTRPLSLERFVGIIRHCAQHHAAVPWAAPHPA